MRVATISGVLGRALNCNQQGPKIIDCSSLDVLAIRKIERVKSEIILKQRDKIRIVAALVATGEGVDFKFKIRCKVRHLLISPPHDPGEGRLARQRTPRCLCSDSREASRNFRLHVDFWAWF